MTFLHYCRKCQEAQTIGNITVCQMIQEESFGSHLDIFSFFKNCSNKSHLKYHKIGSFLTTYVNPQASQKPKFMSNSSSNILSSIFTAKWKEHDIFLGQFCTIYFLSPEVVIQAGEMVVI